MDILIDVQTGKYGNVKHVFLFVVVVYFHTHHGFQSYIGKCISCSITIDYQFSQTSSATGTIDLTLTVSP
jgi:hypothetical protein